MRVFHTTNSKVRDGRLEEAIAVAGEAAKVLSPHGGEIRFFLASAAGEEVNGTVFSIEYESPEALGAASDALNEDIQIQALLNRLNAPDSPIVITSQSMGMEMPIGRTPRAGRGSLLEVHTLHVTPGRAADAIAEAAEVCDFMESNGAVNARLLQLTYAGVASGLMAITCEHENMRAHARAGDAWFSDAGLALQMKTMDSAAPSTTRVMSGLYTEVPL